MTRLYIKPKKELRLSRRLSLLIFAGFVVFLGWYGYEQFITGEKLPSASIAAPALANLSVDESPVTDVMIEQYTVPAAHPRYISIPALRIVNARVQSVGLTKDGTLDTPKNISDTAWYDKSVLPGQGSGSVIIDGHNGGISRDGIFAGLDKLKENDEIIIERGDGKKITYSVRENKTETLKETNASGMRRLMTPIDASKEGLGLITCAGNWVPRDKAFDKRTLVRAVAMD